MGKIWQAVELVDDQTVEELIDSLSKLNPKSTVRWSLMGGLWDETKKLNSPDGRVAISIPLST